ncbi:hypothetical protein NA56DRAFT_648104 [Hyaloscypha hepaticicola]|uniref:Uncharacterized protein n=1 Tax=Hyaloscypha hepaticicola TaxID=2082293 RepID=A0A2J6PWP5_9HELO|nr:hypothetical protein NA56DRAFT_648104 [Hyaloscypha hepaticicola]
MSPRGNKSKGKPTPRFTHFRTTNTSSTHEREAPPASTLTSPVSSDYDADSSPEPSSNFKNSNQKSQRRSNSKPRKGS